LEDADGVRMEIIVENVPDRQLLAIVARPAAVAGRTAIESGPSEPGESKLHIYL